MFLISTDAFAVSRSSIPSAEFFSGGQRRAVHPPFRHRAVSLPQHTQHLIALQAAAASNHHVHDCSHSCWHPVAYQSHILHSDFLICIDSLNQFDPWSTHRIQLCKVHPKGVRSALIVEACGTSFSQNIILSSLPSSSSSPSFTATRPSMHYQDRLELPGLAPQLCNLQAPRKCRTSEAARSL